jgi:hypothetical protein
MSVKVPPTSTPTRIIKPLSLPASAIWKASDMPPSIALSML